MKNIVGLIIVSAILVCHYVTHAANVGQDQEWNAFKKNHGKNYKNSTEESQRYQNWKRASDEVKQHNSKFAQGSVTYETQLNQFSDWTQEELESYNKVNEKDLPKDLYASGSIGQGHFINKRQLPVNFSWVDYGYVTPVKNQGSCGSCWSFASTGALEGAYFRKTGSLVSISQQQIVDCNYNNKSGNWGCNGGWYYNTVKYWNANGFQKDTTYPYVAKLQNCTSNSTKYFTNATVLAACKDYGSVNNETVLQSMLVQHGPVAISVAVANSFFSYKSGVFYNATCNKGVVNHSVLIVGYGTENGTDYWLVKNSWGPTWGAKGYIKMARNQNNNCYIAKYPCFVELA